MRLVAWLDATGSTRSISRTGAGVEIQTLEGVERYDIASI